jgi:hypothetical protein
MVRPIVSAWLCLFVAVVPAAAQFGNIFDPPRPPGEVPGRAPARPLPPPQPQYQPTPPPQLPAQSGQAPYVSPAPGAIQSQPLAPLPGTEPTNQQQALPPNQQQALPRPPLPGQRLPSGPAPAANAAPQPGDEVVTELPSQKIANPTAVFSGLDKITGRIIKFDVAINETVQFGALQVTPRACYTRPPTETPNTDAFVEVQEITLQGEVRRLFGGWMFAASPGLHAVEHPVYDVWLNDCKGAAAPTVAVAPEPRPAAITPMRPQQGTPLPRR